LEDIILKTKKDNNLNPNTWEKILNFLGKSEEETPYLLMDKEVIKSICERLGKGIKGAKVFYAMKANPDINVVKFISQQGLNFEIASDGELSLLKTLNVSPEKIISSNPIKSPSFIKSAYSYGIRLFAYDSLCEVEKLSVYAPESKVYIRLSVPNEGSEWPLSKKFGVEPDNAIKLLIFAKEKGLQPIGITFHVGSQCTNIYNWSTAIDKVLRLWKKAESMGIKLKILNIGGGYPVRYTKNVIKIEKIEAMLNDLIFQKFPSDIEIHIEPGRVVVAEAGVFVSKVIGKAKRADENWLYIDIGVFNGLMECIGGIKYSFIVGSRAEPKRWIIAGPSCDSFDVIAKDVLLSEPNIGDYLLIPSAGAYTISYASEFNGFPIPRTILL